MRPSAFGRLRAAAPLAAHALFPGRVGALRTVSEGEVGAACDRASQQELVACARANGSPLVCAVTADRVAACLFENCMRRGEAAQEGAFIVHGSAWVHGWPERGAAFPCAKQDLNGRRRLLLGIRAARSIAVGGISSHCVCPVATGPWERVLVAVAIIFRVDVYVRPLKALQKGAQGLLPLVATLGGLALPWTLLHCPRQAQNKVGLLAPLATSG